ncbi:MAG TPA: hypothetical protein VIJ93_11965, partial [bacterium]
PIHHHFPIAYAWHILRCHPNVNGVYPLLFGVAPSLMTTYTFGEFSIDNLWVNLDNMRLPLGTKVWYFKRSDLTPLSFEYGEDAWPLGMPVDGNWFHLSRGSEEVLAVSNLKALERATMANNRGFQVYSSCVQDGYMPKWVEGDYFIIAFRGEPLKGL